MKILIYAQETDAGLAPLNVCRRSGSLRLCGEAVLERIFRQVSQWDPEPVLITDHPDDSDLWAGDVYSSKDIDTLRSLAGHAGIIVMRGIAYFDDQDLKEFLDSDETGWRATGKTGRPACCLGLRLSKEMYLEGLSSCDWLKEGDSGITSSLSFPLLYPWHLIEANVAILQSMSEAQVNGVVDPGAEVSGVVHVGQGSRVRCGCVIEGPVWIGDDTVIGPNAYIRPLSVIGNRCNFGQGFEMYDSVIDDNTTAKHRSYIGHSVVGRDVNIGCGFVTSDYRHDGGEHVTLIDGHKIETGRRKLGAFLGDRVRTGVQTSLYPGRKLWPDTTTLPGEIVQADVEAE